MPILFLGNLASPVEEIRAAMPVSGVTGVAVPKGSVRDVKK